MIFTSFEFLLFLGVLFPAYWLLPSERARQSVLLLFSIGFYAWWDYRFVPLILGVSVISYLAALALRAERAPSRRVVLLTSVGLMLAALGIFKYANFVLASIVTALDWLDLEVEAPTFSIVLPVGISFFTFQAISYLVDTHRREIDAEQNPVKVALYICFFPQLVAGPIVRASNFMPQLDKTQSMRESQILSGMKLFGIGFVYKALLADSIGPEVDQIFANVEGSKPADLLAATIGFSAQIYLDFAGYSVMAIGLARLFGYELPWNFNYPYAAVNISDFWHRWHISLSSWLRDYLYIPLGGNRKGDLRQRAHLMITMLLGGLWHGASWNFVAWGGMHGGALIIHKSWNRLATHKTRVSKWVGPISRTLGLVLTQLFVLFTWVPFRAQDFEDTTVIWQAMIRPETIFGLKDHGVFLSLAVLPVLVDIVVGNKVVRLPGEAWRKYLEVRPSAAA